MRSKSLSPSASITVNYAEIAERVRTSIKVRGKERTLRGIEEVEHFFSTMPCWPELKQVIDQVFIDEQEEQERKELERQKAAAPKIYIMPPVKKVKKKSGAFSAVVTNQEKADSVIATLHKMADGKENPKDCIMPIRAAMEAGVIRRPTLGEYEGEFGSHCSKGTYSHWTNDAESEYFGNDYTVMVETFKKIV